MCVTAPLSDIQLQVGVSSMSDRPVAEVSNAADAAEYVDRTVISRLRFLPLLGAVVFVSPLPRRTPVLPLTYPPTHSLTHSVVAVVPRCTVLGSTTRGSPISTAQQRPK
jgi:hypothetical protein